MSAPTPGFANADEKTWVLLSHYGGILFGFLAPLVALLTKGNESPTVKAHATEALNFQITWNIISAVGFILGVCGSLIIIGAIFFLVPLAAWIVSLIYSIKAAQTASAGGFFKYPMSWRIVK